jgi:hypothetical protein
MASMNWRLSHKTEFAQMDELAASSPRGEADSAGLNMFSHSPFYVATAMGPASSLNTPSPVQRIGQAAYLALAVGEIDTGKLTKQR